MANHECLDCHTTNLAVTYDDATGKWTTTVRSTAASRASRVTVRAASTPSTSKKARHHPSGEGRRGRRVGVRALSRSAPAAVAAARSPITRSSSAQRLRRALRSDRGHAARRRHVERLLRRRPADDVELRVSGDAAVGVLSQGQRDVPDVSHRAARREASQGRAPRRARQAVQELPRRRSRRDHSHHKSGDVHRVSHGAGRQRRARSLRRSHDRRPGAATTGDHEVPNACGVCHADEAAAELAATIAKWWPDAGKRQARRERLADAFDEATATASARPLLAVIADADEAPTLRGAAAIVLARRFGPQTRTGSRAAAREPDVVLRAKACEALGDAHARVAGDAVAAQLADPSLRVRLACALALLDMRDPRGELALAAARERSDDLAPDDAAPRARQRDGAPPRLRRREDASSRKSRSSRRTSSTRSSSSPRSTPSSAISPRRAAASTRSS